MLNPGQSATTDCQMASAGHLSGSVKAGDLVFKLNSRGGVAIKASALANLFLGLFQLFFELLDFFLNLFDLTGNFGCRGSAFGCQQCFAAIGRATPAGVLCFEFGCVRLVDDQAVVVIEFFTRFDVAQGFDEDPVVFFIGFTVGIAAVIDPT